MSPPTLPPASDEIANIIVSALRDKGYDAGISDHSYASRQWRDFDILIFWSNLSIGSKRHNRSYLQVTWNKRIITMSIYGRRYSKGLNPDPEMTDCQEFYHFDLADPNSLDLIVDTIVRVASQDKYKYPFI